MYDVREFDAFSAILHSMGMRTIRRDTGRYVNLAARDEDGFRYIGRVWDDYERDTHHALRRETWHDDAGLEWALDEYVSAVYRDGDGRKYTTETPAYERPRFHACLHLVSFPVPFFGKGKYMIRGLTEVEPK